MRHSGELTSNDMNKSLRSAAHPVAVCPPACSRTLLSMPSLLQVLQASEDAACLRKFLSLHGLQLLWSWMVDTNDSDALEVVQFRQQVVK